ncbi:MAG TPA: hypothetical protein VK731_08875, partial [Candidatus Cybelea sp.]|nr:hypothetical protein [Candidatus Cybelea sp.]
MKMRLPLYAKILFWFFLNLVFLGVVFLIVARVQFRFGLDSLIAGPGGKNVQNAIHLLNEDLRDTPSDRWNGILSRYGDTYHVQFYLFRGVDQVSGAAMNLPKEVREKMPNGGHPGDNLRPPPPRGGERPDPDGSPDMGPPERLDPEAMGQRERPPQKSMIHTSAPSRYWVIAPIILPDKSHPGGPGPEQRPRLVPMTVVIASESLGAGGLFFDVTPWIIGGIAVVL